MRVDFARTDSVAFSTFNIIRTQFSGFGVAFTSVRIRKKQHSAAFKNHIRTHDNLVSFSMHSHKSIQLHSDAFDTGCIRYVLHTTSFNVDIIHDRTRPAFTNSFIQSGSHSVTYGFIQSRHIHSQPHSTAGDCAPTALPTFTLRFIQEHKHSSAFTTHSKEEEFILCNIQYRYAGRHILMTHTFKMISIRTHLDIFMHIHAHYHPIKYR